LLLVIIPIVIGALWIATAALFAVGGDRVLAAVFAALSPLALLLTVYLRRLKVALAARQFLAEKAARGAVPLDGVTIDTDDLPRWPFRVLLLTGLLAVVALIVAAVRLR
jgi:hypothetical protein